MKMTLLFASPSPRRKTARRTAETQLFEKRKAAINAALAQTIAERDANKRRPVSIAARARRWIMEMSA